MTGAAAATANASTKSFDAEDRPPAANPTKSLRPRLLMASFSLPAGCELAIALATFRYCVGFCNAGLACRDGPINPSDGSRLHFPAR
jgi:hypothetical protein